MKITLYSTASLLAVACISVLSAPLVTSQTLKKNTVVGGKTRNLAPSESLANVFKVPEINANKKKKEKPNFLYGNTDINAEGPVSIVGGEDVNPPRKYKFFVSIGGCAGSLVAPNVVLSAAHCEGGRSTATLGLHKLQLSGDEGEEEFLNIEHIPFAEDVVHPDYRSNSNNVDYWMIRLEWASELYADFTVDLDTPDDDLNVDDGNPHELTVFGFGTLSAGGASPNVMQEVTVDYVTNDECSDAYDGGITEFMLCAARRGKDSCQGDSGGPIIDEDTGKQVGVVSFGIGCADRDFPGVYSRVSTGFEFINDKMEEWKDENMDRPILFNDCVDNGGFYDSDGTEFNCLWYGDEDEDRCDEFGDRFDNGGVVANTACCACGGGSPRVVITPPPTQKPVTTSPTKQPTQTPVTDSPTKQPTTKPVTGSPTKQPTQMPVTDSPTKQPVTGSPTKQPTQMPVTDSPTKQPTTKPVTGSPTMQPTQMPVTDSPTKQPTTKPVTGSPTKQPSSTPSESPSVSSQPSVSGSPTLQPSLSLSPTLIPLLDTIQNNLGTDGYNLCQGDCDRDTDCVGDLLCFRRQASEPVPGCSGDGAPKRDYCFVRPPTYLYDIGNSLGADSLGLCDGDCDEDTDCKDGLRCFQRRRGNLDPVLGCDGIGSIGTDYCFDRPSNYLFDIGNNLGTGSYGLCEGDCDEDADCIGDLLCAKRNDLSKIPGCDGVGKSGNDYCRPLVLPTQNPTAPLTPAVPSSSPIPSNTPTTSPTQNPTSPPTSASPTSSQSPTFPTLPITRVGNNGEPESVYPLGRCEGDCDIDDDCEASFKCFQRDGREEIPGCSGLGDRGTDYCFFRPPNFLFNIQNNLGTDMYNLCEGDCDNDADCKNDLRCFQRRSGSLNPVPGCIGTGREGLDYCFRREPNSLFDIGNNLGIGRYGRCDGDCDNDADCIGDLQCFMRSAFEPIPGCTGTGRARNDYCFKPEPN